MVLAEPIRRSIRLRGFDYASANWYYVTLCTNNRDKILGKVVDDRAFLSPRGHIVNDIWGKLPTMFPGIELDEYVIMPNHIHGIIGIRATVKVAPTLGQIVGAYKSRVIHECLALANIKENVLGKMWQRNYYEHIVCNEDDLSRIREYINHNPANWTKDKLFP